MNKKEVKEYADGHTYQEIADHFDKPLSTMYRYCQRNDIEPKWPSPLESIDEDKAREMAKTCTYREMADYFGVSITSIKKFLVIKKIPKADMRCDDKEPRQVQANRKSYKKWFIYSFARRFSEK